MFIDSHYISSAVLRYDVLKKCAKWNERCQLQKRNRMIDFNLNAMKTKAGSVLSMFHINTATLKIFSSTKPIISATKKYFEECYELG
uniref:Uncharacterized protein n=2 Tax=Panagrolaimus sp. JU765 TaxID=591449 RepID=A0AC34RFL0_9BILA